MVIRKAILPWLRERLRWEHAGSSTIDPALDRAVMARAAGYLMLATGGVVLATGGLSDLASADREALLIVAALALLLAAMAFGGFNQLSEWVFQVMAAVGSVLVSAAVHYAGETGSALAMFYLWITLYAAYFFSRKEIAAHLILITIGSAIALDGGPLGASSAQWSITITTLIVTAFVFRLLREAGL